MVILISKPQPWNMIIHYRRVSASKVDRDPTQHTATVLLLRCIFLSLISTLIHVCLWRAILAFPHWRFKNQDAIKEAID